MWWSDGFLATQYSLPRKTANLTSCQKLCQEGCGPDNESKLYMIRHQFLNWTRILSDEYFMLLQLTDMGFSREQAVDALLHSNGLEQATEYCLTHQQLTPAAATQVNDTEI